MYNCTQLRALRLRHSITLEELAGIIGVSNQYLSRVELSQAAPTWTMEKKCEAAMEQLIILRYEAVKALERDYRSIKGLLLEASEEELYGI